MHLDNNVSGPNLFFETCGIDEDNYVLIQTGYKQLYQNGDKNHNDGDNRW